MPRKVKTAESVAQNRESQRRSRMRQRQIQEQMRAQLDDYERRGVAASLEMQRAARDVARENGRLRLLLARLGVSPAQVQMFLQLSDSEVASKGSGLLPADCSSAVESSKPGDAGRGPESGQIAKHEGDLSSTPALVDPASDARSTSSIEQLETPCDVAANIITDLYGHANAAEALVALGCTETTNCHVKNTKLFQIIDHAV